MNTTATTCDGCAEFERNPTSQIYRPGCLGCGTRSIAASPAFQEVLKNGMTSKYRAALERVFHGDWRTGDTLVRRWYERIATARREHTFYVTTDTNAPEQIRDRNGEVVLRQCKTCGKAESELVDNGGSCQGSGA